MRLLVRPMLGLAALAAVSVAQAQEARAASDPAGLGEILLQGNAPERVAAIEQIAADQQHGMVPALITMLRYLADERPLLASTLKSLTGVDHGTDWHAWMLWQEDNPVKPFDGFDAWKADLMAMIDPNFRTFLYPAVAHRIRLEEIAWGGVRKDGIPALTNPTMIDAANADFMTGDEFVFGVSINGDTRAYPFRFLDWHEMANDVVGGVPVSLAYCTLCGSGILFETHIPTRKEPFVFGSSGFLYRSNKLMYDQATHSLWNQFTGEPVVGHLAQSGTKLTFRPLVITRWADWKSRHPATKTIALETGYRRDYTPGRPYGAYFSSPDLMFPAQVHDQSLDPKEHVFALRLGDQDKAWRLSDFDAQPVIHDKIGGQPLVLIGNAQTRTVRAYQTQGQTLTLKDDQTLTIDGKQATLSENAITLDDGTSLNRLPGHIAYWFAFQNYRPDAPRGF